MTERSDAATAGRGFLVITAAKLWFMVGGVLINFGLPYIFGSSLYGDDTDGRALYGQFIDLNNTLSILSMVMITGVMQSVSRFVAERPEAPGAIVRQALRLMLGVGALVGGGFIAAAPWIAELRNNPGLVNGYRAAGLILFAYGLYTVFIGTLNGQKRFFHQALFDIGFTTLKATLVLGFALAGLGVVGAFSGFALAAVIIMLMAMWRVGRGLEAGVPSRGLYAFAAQVMLYTLVFNVVFKLDVLMLKPIVVDLYTPVAGWLPDGAPVFHWMRERAVEASSDGLVGLYGLAVNVSRIPWQATIAITFVVFPMMSEAVFAEDRERTRLYIRQTMRYSMILVGAAAVVLAAMPGALIALLPKDFAEAAIALAWLAPAYFCFSLFNVVNTLLMGAGRATEALIIGVLTCGLAAGSYALLLAGAESTDQILARTGQGTLIAFAGGLLMGLAVLWRRYGAPVPIGTAVRVLGLGAALVVAGRFMPPTGKIVALGVAVAVGIAFLVGLVVTREFGAEDKARLKRVLRRKG
ncbi:MAG: oligosaccharide flippase family protein [Myxococcales bacterium]|nr:oligosaccharide flippase family protein [Myxococcales bacterium]MCB9546637.1 oligosaccharide flippase family protein [Myxococcales bacterium]